MAAQLAASQEGRSSVSKYILLSLAIRLTTLSAAQIT
jgi:hypothetical protein